MSFSFEEFESFYIEKRYLPNDIGRRENKLNERQLKSRFEKYLQSEEKKQLRFERLISKDNNREWEELKSNLDLTQCLLIEKLLENNYRSAVVELKNNAAHLINVIDPAHVFGKGAHPHMKYDLDNVVPLNRFSHSMLDQNRDPISGEQISSEDKSGWWMFIVGNKTYQELLQRSLNGRN